MADFGKALDKLIAGFEGFTDALRDMKDDHDDVAVADYDDREDHDDDDYRDLKQAPACNGINDDTIITMASGDLRKVIDAYRRLVRLARTGKIPTDKQRVEGHAAVKAVKHLIRKPIK